MKRFDRSPRAVTPEKSRARPPAPGRAGRRWPGPPGGPPRPGGRRLSPLSWRAPVRMPRMSMAWLSRARWARFRRSRRAGLVGLLVVITVFASGTWAATRSPLLDVDHIEVLGASAVPADLVVAAAGVRTGDAMLAVDTGAARARIEAVPRVEQARVERSFPNWVRIHLSERSVTATVARPAGGFALLDGSGRVLADQPERPAGVPEVTGVGEAPAPGQWLDPAKPLLAAITALPEPLRREVTSAGLSDGAVVLRVGGRDVRFGPAENLAAKAAALEALLAHLGDRAVAFVDVRVPSAPVVGPIPAPSGSASRPQSGSKPGAAGTAPRD